MGTTVEFYKSLLRGRFSTTAEPTLEGQGGTDSINRAVADGGQIPDIVDGDPASRLTIDTGSESAKFRFDMALNERVIADCVIVANHNARENTPADEREVFDLYHDTDATFSGATLLVPTSAFAGLIGQDRTFLNFDEVNDYVSKSNDANLNFGVDDFSIEIIYRTKMTSVGGLITKGVSTDANYEITTRADGTLRMRLRGGGTSQLISTTSTGNDGEFHHAIFAADRSGNGLWYFDGGSAEGSTALTSPGGADSLDDVSQDLVIGIDDTKSAIPFGGDILLIRLWNRNLSTSDRTDLFNGNAVAAADQWGSRTGQTSGTLTVGKNYFIIDYIASDDFINVGAASNAAGIEFEATGTTPTTWANSSTLHQIGAVAEYRPEGISDTQGKWFDLSSNNLDGTITGAETKLGPGNSTYFAKFAATDARYWFLEINPDQLSMTSTDLKVGQWDICEVFTPSLNPDINSITELQSYDGIDTVEKYGGGTDVSERYGRRRVWTYGWSFLTDADKASFQDLLEQTKKRVVYFSNDADDAFPHIYAVRIFENPQFTTPAFEAHNIVLTIVEEP